MILRQPHTYNLTKTEVGLQKAILENAVVKKAFDNLVKHGYQQDILVKHLTMWAKSAEVWKAVGFKPLKRDEQRRLGRFAMRLRQIASELATEDFHRNLCNPKLLNVHRLVREHGGRNMARGIALLPDTLRGYARLMIYTVSTRRAMARHRKTLTEHLAVMTRAFFDEVKRATSKDRVDSVVLLFDLSSRHFGLGKHFNKKALSGQLKRLREKKSQA